jgi:outer membrane protein TolC
MRTDARGSRLAAVALAAAALAGCTTFSPDGGFDEVRKLAAERIGQEVRWQRTDEDAQSAAAEVKRLLAQALTADDAVQIALLNNRGLQASYADLGIAEADVVQANRIGNPRFLYMRTKHGDERKIEWALTFPVFDLITMPLKMRIADRQFARTQLDAARSALDVAIETRKSWVAAVAAEETVRYMEQVREAAEASAELARRMARAGNFPRLTQMREQVFYAEAVAQLARARQAALAERERLVRLMGLYGDEVAFRLPERLPDPPPSLPDRGDVEAVAIAQRLDIRAAKRDNEGVAESLGLTRATRFINALELGPAQTYETPEPWKTGFELSLEIPLFDWGSAKVAKAEAIYMQSVNRVAETAVNARSQVREAYSAWRTAYETARHYREEIVPLRKKISEEQLLRYNGMLISVFELLIDAREQVASVNAAIEALREFWLAEADLQAALNGAGAGRAGGGPRAVAMPAAERRGGH